jgi:type I restriction-modification system DNA methylase subunit
MAAALDRYNPNTLKSENPAQSRDLLKKLYQELMPRTVRHDLGEFYTPDWLAEHVLNEIGYDGNPEKRLLDPSCGSGTFLVMAINRVKEWYDENRENCPYNEVGLAELILKNIIGFDLNPLAVMAARTNYLIAIREAIPDLTKRLPHIQLPIYLCDSVVVPQLGEKAFEKNACIVPTIATDFPIQKDIVGDQALIDKYTEILEDCIWNNYTAPEFFERLRTEGIKVNDEDIHADLYKAVYRLNEEDRNRVWARIIKNAFAPLFIGKVDIVAGNPPWVNWENLPKEYRDKSKGIWENYGLFKTIKKGTRLGSVKKDLSMLFTYACVDRYLNDGGKLGFVITQTVFKTQAGHGFRRFRFSSQILKRR